MIAIALFLGVGYGVYHLNAEVLLTAAAGVAGIIALLYGFTGIAIAPRINEDETIPGS